jgi:hypothetical protein
MTDTPTLETWQSIAMQAKAESEAKARAEEEQAQAKKLEAQRQEKLQKGRELVQALYDILGDDAANDIVGVGVGLLDGVVIHGDYKFMWQASVKVNKGFDNKTGKTVFVDYPRFTLSRRIPDDLQKFEGATWRICKDINSAAALANAIVDFDDRDANRRQQMLKRAEDERLQAQREADEEAMRIQQREVDRLNDEARANDEAIRQVAQEQRGEEVDIALPPVPKYYRVVRHTGDPSALEAELNRLAADGYRVRFTMAGDDDNYGVVILQNTEGED